MKTQTTHNVIFDDCGDVISIETFISHPEALAIEEQQALKMLTDLLKRLQTQATKEAVSND